MLVLVCYVLSKILFIAQYLLNNCTFDGYMYLVVPNHDHTYYNTGICDKAAAGTKL